MTRAILAPFLVLVALVVAGCGGSSSDPTTDASPVRTAAQANLVLERASGTPVVTLDGLVDGGRRLPVDMASLDTLPARSLTVVEPFVKKSMTFDGVSFADLLDAAKATGTSLTVHALDDYEVTFEASVLRDQGALLATSVDGAPIGLPEGGPVRLVFPASSKAGADTDLWVWSIDRITVE